MTNLLEISGNDIALLNDTDLRILIGRLCEEDFRLAGLPTKGIIWGGHQDASDDGLDVTVRSEYFPPKNSFVPRKITGIQVKKPNMPRAKILGEMQQNGELRKEIQTLIHENGAYIIVSSNGSTTEKALKNRVNAMKEAVANEPQYQQLHLDFLDRNRVATWVRSHPSLILWVRNKIERSLQGWQPYGNWANSPGGIREEYLIDDELRLHDGTSSSEGNSILDGLHNLRLRLLNGNASVRLTGLSGVGKTRLIQALFDNRVGEHAINPSLAYYTDISDSPNPDPVSFANQLIHTKTKAILIVDNCSLELHRQLTKSCANSNVNLLTIEYDIRDDLPEETNVFRLEPASDTLIENLIERRYVNISQTNARTISEFAGGNARIAIALANTLKQGESLSTLRDEELFERLFHQRHNPNENLRLSAEVCSLVYSFNGEYTDSETSELEFLANLVEKSSRELFRDIEELRKRGLVQSRSIWRAVLPHAIANRLAKHSLDSIPSNILVNTFLTSGSERLIQSFTRRLGYLHDCMTAIKIANDWLQPDGWLGETNCNLSSFGLTVFKNIAPIIPEKALAMLERATSDEPEQVFTPEAARHRSEFIRLLQHLAYEPEFFERSVSLLCRCALLEKPDINDGGSARATLETLFHIILSGTLATPQIRADIIDELVNSGIQSKVELGITLLKSTLQTHHFHNSNASNFGARSRDFGYWPKSNQEIIDWYTRFVSICTHIALSDKPIASKAKRVLANNLRGLWITGTNKNQGFLKLLEYSVLQIHEKQAWNEGWISIKGILRYESKSMQKEALARLKQLEKLLKPTNLLEKVRTYALIEGWLNFDLEEDFNEDKDISSHLEQLQHTTRELGVEIAQDIDLFKRLLPELVTNSNHRLRDFGAGLAEGCENKNTVWHLLYSQLKKTLPEKRQITVFLGFLSSCAYHDPNFYNTTLDNLVQDGLLGQWFPYFQVTSVVDKRGIKRLHKSLDSDNANVHSFQQLAYHHRSIDDDNLATLIEKILTKEGGLIVAIELLTMRFHRSKDEPMDFSPNLMAVGRDVISKFPYDDEQIRINHLDYSLAQIARICLNGTEGIETTKKICKTLADGFHSYQISIFDYMHLPKCLAQIQPYIFLDAFIGKNEIKFDRMGFDDRNREDNPVNFIPESEIIDWCDRDSEVRYPQIVSSMQTYSQSKRLEELQWSPLVFSILEKAPNVQMILSRLEANIVPMGWSGSRADATEKRLVLFTILYDHANPVVQEWAKAQYIKLEDEIKRQRQYLRQIRAVQGN